MSSNRATPGVYITGDNPSPNNIIEVATAVPVFIGYTAKATDQSGKSVAKTPIRVTSLAEYEFYFGSAYAAKFSQVPATGKAIQYFIGEKPYHIVFANAFSAYLYNSIRFFYANGGGACYILSIGTYGDKPPEEFAVNTADYLGNNGQPSVFDILKRLSEPTILLMPDAISLGEACYTSLYLPALQHCGETQNKVALFDLIQTSETKTYTNVATTFRNSLQAANALNYGAAYYPWINTNIVAANEIDFQNLDGSFDLTQLPELRAQAILQQYNNGKPQGDADKKAMQQALLLASPTYVTIMNNALSLANLLPPSGAMAGVYTTVDNMQGVWIAPANVVVNAALSPAILFTDDMQGTYNVDAVSGISINVIRSFPNRGTVVWGARTFDGNSQDWRYINVRRTLIMIEQSIKLYTSAFVFEPNAVTTWGAVTAGISNFLMNLWKAGALVGAKASDAFSVNVGLGTTMTSDDILNGYMNVTVKIAITHPAEFIVMTFQQQMQAS